MGTGKSKFLLLKRDGPYQIVFNNGEVTNLKDVLIGEVWVCSGQSNMEMPLAGWG